MWRCAKRWFERNVYERCGDAPSVGLSGTSTSNAARPERGSERNVYERDRLQPAQGEHTNDKTLLDILYRGQEQQQTLMNSMWLPKVGLLNFDGDPLNIGCLAVSLVAM